MTHTPGPWYIVESPILIDIRAKGYNHRIAQLLHINPNCRADADLITAAPDLLEACEEMADLIDDIASGDYKPDSFSTQSVRMAIAKAKGGK